MSGQFDALSMNELTGKLVAIERAQIKKYVEELNERIAACTIECMDKLLSQKSKDLTTQTASLKEKLSKLKDELVQDYKTYFKKEESDFEKASQLEKQLDEGIKKAVDELQTTTDFAAKRKQLQEASKASSLFERIPVFNPRREEKLKASRLYAELVEARIRKKIEQEGPSLEKSEDIWSACKRGDLEYLEEAVQQEQATASEAAFYSRSRGGDLGTPLEIAALAGHAHIVGFLLQKEVPIPPISSTRRHLAHWVAKEGHTAVMTLLVAKSHFLVNARDEYNRTPLHFATRNGRKDVTRFLQEHGSDVNAQAYREQYFETPLHQCLNTDALSGEIKLEIVTILASSEGLDVTIENGSGDTALDLILGPKSTLAARYKNLIAKVIISHSSWRFPSLQDRSDEYLQMLIRLVKELNCHDAVLTFYEERMNLAEDEEQQSEYRRQLLDWITLHTDIRVSLRGYRILFPKAKNLVQDIARRVVVILDPVMPYRSQWIDFFQIALFSYPSLSQMMDCEAHNMSCEIALGFEGGVGKKMEEAMEKFSKGHQPAYALIISDIETKVHTRVKKMAKSKGEREVVDEEKAKLNMRLAYLDRMQQETQQVLDTFYPLFQRLVIKEAVKTRVQSEKIYLTQMVSAPITLYYQTLLSDVSCLLQIIFMLQNPHELITPQLGRPGSLANRLRKDNVIEGVAEKNPGLLQRCKQWLRTVIDHRGDIAEVAGKVSPLLAAVPYVGGVLKAAVDQAIKVNDRVGLNVSREVLMGQTMRSIDKIGDEIARELTFSFRDVIPKLSEEGAKEFAEAAALRVIAALLNGQIEDFQYFAEEAVFVMRAFEVQAYSSFFGIEIPWTQSPLKVQEGLDLTCTADDLYRLCGVAVYEDVEGDKQWSYYSNDPYLTLNPRRFEARIKDSPQTRAEQFGYMQVSKQSWEKFRSRVPLLARDEEKLHPHQS